VLRGEWGFRGYVVSDNLALYMLMSQHHYVSTVEDAAAVSMKAGVNLELTDNQLPGVHWHLLDAVAQASNST
jgi:beta-glucosidase